MKESWFEDESYWIAKRPLLYNKKNMWSAFMEVDQLIKLLSLKPGDHILDLCCGVGRHSLNFAKKGLQVTGLDITQAYLSEATTNAQQADVAIEYIHGDARAFRREATYDYIFNLWNSFGYFDEQTDDGEVLKNCYYSLKPGGKLLIDVFGKEVTALTFRQQEHHILEGHQLTIENAILDNWNRIESNWKVDGKEIKNSYRIYSAQELQRSLKQSGFETIEIYGNFKKSPYDHCAKRLVLIAQK